MRRLALFLLALLALAACRIGQPSKMSLAFSAYADRPVVLTRMAVNGKDFALTPLVVRGRADVNRPFEGAGRRLMAYPPGPVSGRMVLDLTWVELPAGTGYAARVEVPLDRLEAAASGGVEFMPVFGPGGLLIIASDPVPKTADATATTDAARICADRAPGADQDFTAEPGALPALPEALASAKTTPAESEC